jgi:hypothetical protein
MIQVSPFAFALVGRHFSEMCTFWAAACDSNMGFYDKQVRKELYRIAALLEGEHLDEAVVQCERVERLFLSEQRRLRDWERFAVVRYRICEAWGKRIPCDLHPYGRPLPTNISLRCSKPTTWLRSPALLA